MIKTKGKQCKNVFFFLSLFSLSRLRFANSRISSVLLLYHLKLSWNNNTRIVLSLPLKATPAKDVFLYILSHASSTDALP